MRRLLSGLVFGLVLVVSVAAQGNGNGNNGNGYGNGGNGGYGNGNGNAIGQANSPWGNWPQWLINWLENGGQIPQLLAADVIFQARAWGQQNFNLSYGQMLQKYAQGQLTIEFVSTAPPSLTFRVRYGGLLIGVIIDG